MTRSSSLATRRYSIQSRARKYVIGYGFLSFVRNLSKKYRKQLLDIATKTGLDALKIAPKKVVHKAAEATGEFVGKKIADKIVKPNPISAENSRNVEEIVISPEKREEIVNKLRKIL